MCFNKVISVLVGHQHIISLLHLHESILHFQNYLLCTACLIINHLATLMSTVTSEIQVSCTIHQKELSRKPWDTVSPRTVPNNIHNEISSVASQRHDSSIVENYSRVYEVYLNNIVTVMMKSLGPFLLLKKTRIRTHVM